MNAILLESCIIKALIQLSTERSEVKEKVPR